MEKYNPNNKNIDGCYKSVLRFYPTVGTTASTYTHFFEKSPSEIAKEKREIRERKLKRIWRITYEDFEIGQKVVCCVSEKYNEERLYDMYMTVGKTYTIKDLDFHFWDAICITKDNGGGAFFPIDNFVDEKEMIRIDRERKLKRVLKK